MPLAECFLVKDGNRAPYVQHVTYDQSIIGSLSKEHWEDTRITFVQRKWMEPMLG
jgi:hypothetical protein